MLDYFLINWEILQFCKKENIWVGPARGSAAGCLLSWCLSITKIDPLRFDLYFERFLNPSRNKYPDKKDEIVADNLSAADEYKRLSIQVDFPDEGASCRKGGE